MAIDLTPGVVGFAIELALGAVAIYVGAAVAFYDESASPSIDRAVTTALIGAVLWSILVQVPLVGTLLGLAGWVLVIGLRYPGEWPQTVVIGLLAWLAGALVLAALSALGVDGFSPLGVPQVFTPPAAGPL